MPVIKSINAPQAGPHTATFNFDDLSCQANAYLERVRRQANEIVQEANREAAEIRKRHEKEAKEAAEQSIQQRVERLAEEQVHQRVQTLLPALERAVTGIQQAREQWLAHWEKQAVHLAAAMAARVIRRELRQSPEISLSWLKEALDLAVGASRLRIRLHPADYEALGEAARSLLARHAGQASAELVSDPRVSPGGCLVETEHGRIDQQIESQVARIEQELLGE